MGRRLNAALFSVDQNDDVTDLGARSDDRLTTLLNINLDELSGVNTNSVSLELDNTKNVTPNLNDIILAAKKSIGRR